MSERRGADYAHHLNPAERRALGRLLGAQQSILDSRATVDGPASVGGGRSHPPPVRSRRAPLAVAVLTALVLSAAAVAQLHPAGRWADQAAGRPTSMPSSAEASGSTPPDPEAVLRELAAVARRSSPLPGSTPSTHLHRSTLEAAVTAGTTPCAITGLSVELDYTAGVPVNRPLPAKLAAKPVALSVPATANTGCVPGPAGSMPTTTGAGGVMDSGGDLAELWSRLRTDWRGTDVPLDLPAYTDPRGPAGRLPTTQVATTATTLDGQLTKLSLNGRQVFDRRTFWRLLVALLASPEVDSVHAVTALLVAANNANELSVVAAATADIQGRPGVTVLFPSTVDGVDATEAVTFDRSTGRLLQRLVRPVSGPGRAQITVYV